MLRKLLAFFILLMIVLAMGFASAVYIHQLLDEYFHRETVKVPDMVGQRLPDALNLIRETQGRLKLEIASEVESDAVPRDQIISQDPAGGTDVNIEHTIDVTISKGSRVRAVPALVGQPLRQARLLLSSTQLRVGSKSYIRDGVHERGTILAQWPEGKSQAGVHQDVDLLVSDGPADPGAQPLPRLAYLTLDKAKDILRTLGITTVKTDEVLAPDIPVGTVMDQDPPPGMPARADGSVTLTISKGTGLVVNDRRQLWVQFEMPPGLTDKQLDVDVTDTTTTTRIHSAVHAPGEIVHMEVQGQGALEVKYYLDGSHEPSLVQRY